MNHTRFRLPLVAAVLLPLGALAAEPAVKDAQKAAEAPKAAEADKVPGADKAKPTQECEASTATRIRPSKDEPCPKPSQPVRSYSREEIERTGQIDVGEALRRLDPRFH